MASSPLAASTCLRTVTSSLSRTRSANGIYSLPKIRRTTLRISSSRTFSSSNSVNQSASILVTARSTTVDSPDQTPKSTKPSPTKTADMSSKLIPQNPADVMVIRDITPNVVTFSVPFARGGFVKIGGRATLVRLSSGTLAVFSPVALTPAVRSKIDELIASGPAPETDPTRKVSYIVAPDMEHHIFLSEWKAAYPGAKLIGPAGLPEKRKKQVGSSDKIKDDHFDVVFPLGKGKLDVRVDAEFDLDFEYELVDAHPNKELVFFYRPDRVLVEADLMFNLPATEQYSRVPESQRAHGFVDRLFATLGSVDGDVRWPRRAQWYLFSRADRDGFNRSIAKINTWDFVTVIPCHGETIIGNGKDRFRNLFEWHLQAVQDRQIPNAP